MPARHCTAAAAVATDVSSAGSCPRRRNGRGRQEQTTAQWRRSKQWQKRGREARQYTRRNRTKTGAAWQYMGQGRASLAWSLGPWQLRGGIPSRRSSDLSPSRLRFPRRVAAGHCSSSADRLCGAQRRLCCWMEHCSPAAAGCAICARRRWWPTARPGHRSDDGLNGGAYVALASYNCLGPRCCAGLRIALSASYHWTRKLRRPTDETGTRLKTPVCTPQR